jgi:hypothetical protein
LAGTRAGGVFAGVTLAIAFTGFLGAETFTAFAFEAVGFLATGFLAAGFFAGAFFAGAALGAADRETLLTAFFGSGFLVTFFVCLAMSVNLC